MAVSAFAAPVASRADLIWYEGFNYPNGSLTNVSGGLWIKNSGSATPSDMLVNNRSLEVASTGGAVSRQDDCYRNLAITPGSPYTNTVQVLYASFTVICTNLPNPAGSYFASFYRNGSPGGFCGRIQALTTNTVLPNTWRLGISANASASATGVLPRDLALNTPYQVVAQLDPVTLLATTVWINPIQSTDPAATSNDGMGYSTTSPVNGFAFRQASSFGNAFFVITNLALATTFDEAVTNIWTTNAVDPVVIRSPNNITNFVGVPVAFSVLASGQGFGNLNYQWRKNGVGYSNPDGNTNLLSFPNPQAGDSGSYDVVVTTPYGLSVTSSPAYLSISTAPVPPVVTAGPNSQTVYRGQTVTFSVTVSGPGNITYQWKSNAVDIVGETSPTLTLPNADPSFSASYRVGVTNEFGGVLSSNAVLTVLNPPAVSIAYLRKLVDPVTYQATNVPPTLPYQATGIVTTFTNLTTGNTASYYLQDGTAGINIFATLASSFRPQLGDVVTFVGVVSSFASGLELYADTVNRPYTSYSILSNNIAGLPAPISIPFDITNNLDNCNYVLAGSRVKLSNVYFGASAGTVVSTTANQFVTVTNALGKPFSVFFSFQDLDTAGQTLPAFAGSVTGVLYGNNPNFSVAVTRFSDIDTNPVVVPIPLNFGKVAGNVILTWEDPSFALQASGQAAGPYTNVPGAVSPFTVYPTNEMGFFRLIH